MKASPTKLPKLSQYTATSHSLTDASEGSRTLQYSKGRKKVEDSPKISLDSSHRLPEFVSAIRKEQTNSGQNIKELSARPTEITTELHQQKTPEKNNIIPSIASLKSSNIKVIRQDRLGAEKLPLDRNSPQQALNDRLLQRNRKPLYALVDTDKFSQRTQNLKINDKIKSARFRTETDESRSNNQIEALISPRLFKGKLHSPKLSPSHLDSNTQDQLYNNYDPPSKNYFLKLSEDYYRKTKSPNGEEDISDLYLGLFNQIHSPARFRHMYKTPLPQLNGNKGNSHSKRLVTEPSSLNAKTVPLNRDYYLAKFQINEDERKRFTVEKKLEFRKIERHIGAESPKKRFPKLIKNKLPEELFATNESPNHALKTTSIGTSPKKNIEMFSPRSPSFYFKPAQALESKLNLQNDLKFDASTFVDANGNEIHLKAHYFDNNDLIESEQERLFEESSLQLNEALNGMNRRVPSYATERKPTVKKTRKELAEALLAALKNIKRMHLTPEEIMKKRAFSTLPFERPGSKLFFEAIKLGNLVMVQTLLERKGKYMVYEFDNVQQTPLHWAVKLGYDDIVKHLIDSNADVNARDILDRTPLYYAIKNENFELVKLLLLNKCDPWDFGEVKLMDLAKNNPPLQTILRKARQMDLVLKMMNSKDREEKWEQEKGNLFQTNTNGTQ